MSQTICMVVDVGASNTRVRVLDLVTMDVHLESSGVISSSNDFISLVEQIVNSHGDITAFCGGFAGVIGDDRTTVRMTNWSSDSCVEAVSIARLGIQTVLFLNDVEAAAYALTDIENTSLDLRPLCAISNGPRQGNKVLILPGTGLGSAGILGVGGSPACKWTVIASEAQHFVASSKHDESNRLIAELRCLFGHRPSWEDCVSGPGLESLYKVAGGSDDCSATVIARRALSGDPVASTALSAYYIIAGSFAQQLALSFLSFGGVFIAGGNALKNEKFLSNGQLVEQFRNSLVMGQALSNMPVFHVANEINLTGAVAASILHFGGGH
jgi:glucokinase